MLGEEADVLEPLAQRDRGAEPVEPDRAGQGGERVHVERDPYNLVRKMACNFGWDWGPRLITAGIWKSIGLRSWDVDLNPFRQRPGEVLVGRDLIDRWVGDEAVSDIFGYNALQLGLPQIDLLAENRIPFRQRVGLPAAGDVDIHCDLRQLPIAANSIDLVVLPHVLEFYEDPHQILREVERVLIPEGQVVITGFNPYSLWGMRRHLPPRSRNFPWQGQYLSLPRIKDWLQLLGFEVERGSFGCYAPPFSEANHLRRWHFMELAGNRWWPYGGATYIIHAIKRVHGMRLILPGWRERVTKARAIALAGQGKPQPVPHSPHQTKTHDSC